MAVAAVLQTYNGCGLSYLFLKNWYTPW